MTTYLILALAYFVVVPLAWQRVNGKPAPVSVAIYDIAIWLTIGGLVWRFHG